MDDPPTLQPSQSKPSSTRRCFDNHEERQRKRASFPSRPNAAARHSKRLTLNFPISTYSVLSDQTSPSTYGMSPLAQSSTFPSPTRSAVATPELGEPVDEGYMFLTALAAQERKVLELREELQKAEGELANLKKQWATGEKGRKRTEIVHHAEVMKPLKAPADETVVNGVDAEPSVSPDLTKLALQTRMSRELERRNGSRQLTSQVSLGGGSIGSGRPRTVFQSSRHTRTLSLLSPNGVESLSHAQTTDVFQNSENVRGSSHPRSATLPSIDRNEKNEDENAITPARSKVQAERNLWRRSLPVAQDGTADILMRTGKQMASDFKDGLWTFLEDIRQATVGEEGISATESRSMHGVHRASRSSKQTGMDPSTSRARSAASSATARSVPPKNKSTAKASASQNEDASFWSEFGIDSPDLTTQKNQASSKRNNDRKKKAAEPSLLDADDNWDVWDTPQPKAHTPSSSSSTFPSSRRDKSPSTRASSPRTSASFTDLKAIEGATQSDGIPWPALTKLHPSNLTRTASSLMAEWERSLSPSPSPSFSHEAESKDLKHD
ncbi:hypothetical protein PRK78_001672 [Emydomyces testavorans]|uniref:DUF4048 domain-containing protein n=1 Tax=Emydomyces testavorans TaxID=2070801 RepID=A0AAF0IGX4_9EURO|nr:hypothetical protein PRK78_001672 [Emydomyces testavorans]